MKENPFNPKFQSLNTESKIVVALERISEAFRVLLWNEGKQYKLSPIQIQVLIFLLHHSEAKRKVTCIADEFNMTKATISDTVKSLEQKEIIKKEYVQHDTRSYIIHLTDKGREIAGKTAMFSKEIQSPIDKLHPDDKENLLSSLLNIIHHLNQSGIITVQRMCFTCSHYRKNHNGHPHYCQLLNQRLALNELRIDCNEHRLMNA